MMADNTNLLRVATRERSERTRQRAETTLAAVRAAGGHVSVAEFCRTAGISRGWLYTQPDLLDELRRLPPAAPSPTPATGGAAASAESLRRRLQLAQRRIDDLTADNRDLRNELAVAYGQLRLLRQS